MNKNIFRAYDIRGNSKTDLDQTTITKIGYVLGERIKKNDHDSVYVGHDSRLSAQEIQNALVAGFNAADIKVFLLGMVPTPMVYFATKTGVTPNGVMITGSHNPKDDNGLKIVINDDAISGLELLSEVEKQADVLHVETNCEKVNLFPQYQKEINQKFRLNKKIKVVLDAGNGAAGEVADSIFKSQGFETISINKNPDGNFPNHHPDPGKEKNLVDLINKVKEVSADVGVAFDGDGDRLGAVTSSGRLIYPDQMMMLFSKKILSDEGGKTIIFDVKCSDFLPQIIKDNGGIPFMSPTGHFHIKNNIKKYNAVLGGEMSGHIFFNDIWHGFDDGHYSAIRLLDIMNETGLSLDDLLDSLPVSYSTPELNIDVPEERKFKIIEDFIENASIDGEKNFTDGLRASFENGWALLRASNTTPKLVLRFEANSQESLEKIQKNFLEELKKFLPNQDINLE